MTFVSEVHKQNTLLIGFDLVDFESGNFPLESCCEPSIFLELREKVVICCRVGASRSNTIAVGVLVRYFKMDFHKALELVISKVPICNILQPHIMALQKLFKC